MFRNLFAALAVVFAVAVALPAAAQSLQPATIPNPQVGVPYTQTFTPSGYIPNNFSAVGIPPGLTFTNNIANATLSGTPTTAGPYNFTVYATGFNGFSPVVADRGYTVTVQPAAVAVPTMSEWAMILFGVILAGAAALYVQRRRLTV